MGKEDGTLVQKFYEAALRHFVDAQILEREECYDNAVYLYGNAAECALKALMENTPAEQATAYVELLDKLGIDRVYLLATSAGGSVAIRFALDYPERTKGLILYCYAMTLQYIR